ncbi:DUF6179 domain-containing protein [Anaerosporobacter sp.]|uniref:DUF6179 domain-containing protein n=1 Tax=Anaerosporobacter sp. TaxID=1872529 RepID=UPI00286F0BA7|nr:DUF6179 domain-containing protein [Anaerosporobacter sp.]
MDFQPQDLFPLLKTLSEKYTCKESTSVSYETAQQLMEAILYCIHENDSTTETTALMETSSYSAEQAYEQGYALVVSKIKQAHTLYNHIMLNFNGYGNEAYEETLIAGLPSFFTWYDPKFAPQNHIILIDYPILTNLQHLNGIDLIYEYLKCIELEQLLLSSFPKEYIQRVLSQYHPDYSELIINTTEILLKNILVNLLLKMNTPTVQFHTIDCEKLQQSILQTERDVFLDLLTTALATFIDQKLNNRKDLLLYLTQAIPNIATELINAARNNCINAILGGDLYG